MSFLELAKSRYSCRAYRSEPLERNLIEQVLEAGRIAPSACNNQPWSFFAVSSPEMKGRLNLAYSRDWFRSAPVAVVICGDRSKSWKRRDGKDYCDIDIAIAADHMTLQAADLGLATCWICNFDAEKCAETLRLSDNLEPVVILSMGYPADKPAPERHAELRKNLSEISSFV